jgi:protein-S-isoprenylcysteine O-methyltransferase Ste14
MNLLKTALFLLFVPGTVTMLVPYRIAAGGGKRVRLGIFRYVAVLAWAMGASLLLPSFWNFVFRGRGTPHPADPPRELVASGPYRFTRNLQYLGVLSILVGHFLWTGALWLLPYSAMVAAAFHTFITCYEEPNLEKRFGIAYQRYRERKPRWLGSISQLFKPEINQERGGGGVLPIPLRLVA